MTTNEDSLRTCRESTQFRIIWKKTNSVLRSKVTEFKYGGKRYICTENNH